MEKKKFKVIARINSVITIYVEGLASLPEVKLYTKELQEVALKYQKDNKVKTTFRSNRNWDEEPATDRQKAFLKQHKIEFVKNLTKRQASMLITKRRAELDSRKYA